MRRYIILIMLFSFIPSYSYGEETYASFDEMLDKDIEYLTNIKVEKVVSTSKVEEEIIKSPASITVISSYEIKAFGYRNLAEVLSTLKGFFITYDRNYNYAGTRGLYKAGDYNSRILLLVDGHQINDNIFDQAYIGNEFIIDLELIDRIEVIRGPLSPLYGGNALFGVINIITKGQTENEAYVSFGSYDTYKGGLILSHKFSENNYILGSATYYTSHGPHLYFKEFDTPDIGDGRNNRGDYENYPSFFAKTRIDDLTISGGYISRKKGIPTGAWDIVYNDKRNFSIDEKQFFEIKYEHLFSNKLNTMGRFYLDKYTYYGNYVYPDDLQKEVDSGNMFGLEIKNTLYDKYFNLTGGFEFRKNFMQDMSVYSLSDGYTLDFKHNSYNAGIYLSGIIDVMDNLRLNLAGRYDIYQYYDNEPSFRFAVIYNPYRDGVFKLILANSFRHPNIYEMYYNDGNFTQKAPESLKPESIKQAELVYEHIINKNLTLSAGTFFSDIHDLIGFDIDPSDGLIVAKNIENIQIFGAEAEASYITGYGIIADVNYSYSYPYNHGSKEEIKSFPSHMLNMKASYPFYHNRVTPALSFKFTSMRETIRGNSLDPIYLVNLNLLFKDFIKGFECSIGVYNLLDQKYYDPASIEHPMDAIEQNGINYNIRIGGRF